ncbi:hypothetical protein ACGFYY_16325 [Streptomyces sp. NPDC048331]|uniref:hypothetical protein n=1 Tax=Streptomyces sp. NPDC048331 TaxID=3365534 RepID=UPI00372046E4
MHNPVAERDDLAFDFGATALGRSFHYDWTNYAVSPLDHIAQRYGERGDPTPILLLVEDLLRLRDSDLSGGEINLLWCATDIALGAPVTAGKERDWLQEVGSFVVPLAKSRGASTAACSTYPECVPDGTSPAAAVGRPGKALGPSDHRWAEGLRAFVLRQVMRRATARQRSTRVSRG